MSERSRRLTLAAAAPFELQPTAEALAARGWDLTIHVVGIGCLEAARSVAKQPHPADDAHVLFVGSAGVFGDFAAPFLTRAEAVSWLPTGERLGHAYTIADTAPSIDLTVGAPLDFDLPTASVICSPTISLVAHPKPGDGLWIENIELYAVAADMLRRARSFTAILGVTNAVGPESHTQWIAHHQRIAHMTRDVVLQELVPGGT